MVLKNILFGLDNCSLSDNQKNKHLNLYLLVQWGSQIYKSSEFKIEKSETAIIQFVDNIEQPIQNYTFIDISLIAKSHIGHTTVARNQLNLQNMSIPNSITQPLTSVITVSLAKIQLSIEERKDTDVKSFCNIRIMTLPSSINMLISIALSRSTRMSQKSKNQIQRKD